MAKAKAAPVEKRPAGRPSTYSEKTATLICNLVSCGMSIRKICAENDNLPEPTTIYKWLSEQPLFSQQYARAREDAAAFMAEELLDIVDDESGDTVEVVTDGDKTRVVANHVKVQRDKLRADTRKWLLSKLAPRKYGDLDPDKPAAGDKTVIEVKGGLPGK